MNKGGVSDVVATVLIIALTILAISILWVGVIPLVKNNLGVNDVCSNVDVSISTSHGYTCYQQNGITAVQINKGSRESNISGLKFYLISNGNSIQYAKDITLGKNSFTSFFLNSSTISKVEKLQVVPVVKNGNVVKDCPATYISSISTCGSAGFSAAEIAQVINVSNGTTSGSGGITQDTTYSQFSSYQDNNATLLDSGIGLFNVTVINTNGTVLLEINNTNVTATNLGNGIYNASYGFTANGTYSYRWYSYGNGSSNNLGVSSSRNYVVYKAGKALSFNGNNQYAQLKAGSLVAAKTSGTISSWIKLNGAGILYSESDGGGVDFMFGTMINGTYGRVWNNNIWYNTYSNVSGLNLVDNVWHNVVFVWSDIIGKQLYLDGVNIGGNNSEIHNDNAGNIIHSNFGVRYESTALVEFFNGSIDELIIWNRSLSSVEISQLYNLGVGLRADTSIAPFNSGLVAGYHLDEGSGTTAYDIIGVNNGTLTNPVYVAGKIRI